MAVRHGKDVKMALMDPLLGFGQAPQSRLGALAQKLRALVGSSHPERSMGQAGSDIVSLVEERTNREQMNFSLIDAQTLAAWDIHLLAYPSGGFRNHEPWLASVARSVSVHEHPAVAFQKITQSRPYSSITILDIDVFDDFGDAIDSIQEFRSMSRMTPTIIGSRRFRYNDFSSTRFLIADASIKLPVSRVGLGLALNAALVNHDQVLKRDLDRSRM
jgi:hypothetical protein